MNFKTLEKIIAIVVASVIFITSTIIILCTNNTIQLDPKVELENKISQTEILDNIQQSVTEEEKYFPQNMIAPFVDMVAWVPTTSDYSINGVPNLKQFYDECGADYYCLGFIRVNEQKTTRSDGGLNWCWGGYDGLSEQSNDGYQYEGIKQTILDVKNAGGDVIVSVGGQLGKSPWTIVNDEKLLKNMYLEIIDAYDLKRIDLDIEEENQDYKSNVINARAIKQVQDETGVEVVLTIPVMPYGYDQKQKDLIIAYLSCGVKIAMINNMAMCYGFNGVMQGEDFGWASIRAIKNAATQIKDIYAGFGVDLSEDQCYNLQGVTVDIGYENSDNPVFTTDMTKTVAEFAKEKNLQMFSYWCMNRDSLIQYNPSIYYAYQFYNASLNYLDK